MSYMKGNLLTRTRKLVKGLAKSEPVWLKAMEKFVPFLFSFISIFGFLHFWCISWLPINSDVDLLCHCCQIMRKSYATIKITITIAICVVVKIFMDLVFIIGFLWCLSSIPFCFMIVFISFHNELEFRVHFLIPNWLNGHC